MCRSQSQGGRRCSGASRGGASATDRAAASVPPSSREKYRDDIRYGLSERGPEADHAAQIDQRAQEVADRMRRDAEAELEAQKRGW
jgi:hypothetical protein